MEIKYTIKLPPITKKNSQQIFVNKKTGKRFPAPSKQFQEYEQAALYFLPRRAGMPLEGPLNIKALFYMKTRRKTDLTNLLEALDDILVSAGIIADDNYTVIAAHDGSRCYYDKENPRTEIYITEFMEGAEDGSKEKEKEPKKSACNTGRRKQGKKESNR